MKLDDAKLIAEGKAKRIYENDQDTLLLEFKNSLTAFDGQKKDEMDKKGIFNCMISSKLFQMLEEKGIATHFVDMPKENLMIVKKVEIILVEVVCRNIATGSLIKRLPFKDGERLDPPLVEFFYKNDDYHDPLVNTSHILRLDLATKDDLKQMKELTLKINTILTDFFEKQEITLYDFKLEFGKDKNGNILLADEITPDTCRLRNKQDQKILDKDIFRQNLGGLFEAYQEVFNRVVGD